MIGQSVGSDASPLSCFLFRPRKSCEKRRKRSHTNVPNTLITRTSTPPAQTAHVRFHERKWVHTRLSEKNRTQRLTRRNRGLPEGAAITTLDTYCTFTNIPGPGIRTAYFAAFGSWSETLLKNAESLRDSDALMRVAVPRRRGPAGLRDLFSFLSKLRFPRPVLRAFPCVRGEGRYHYPRRALRAAETLDGRLSKRLICYFLGLTDSSLIPAAQNIVPFLYRCQKDQRDTRWSFHFCSHLLTCPDRPDRGT